jgi:Na+-translocating ferredoxin:NAD+ oxidoreductase RnfG subunit
MGTRKQSVGRLPFVGAAGVLALATAPVQVVIAADYMSVDDAQRAAFPQADHFVEVVLALDAEQRAKVISLAGLQPPHRSLRVWKAMKDEVLVGHVLVDEVVGRQDMITYAIGIDPTGKLGTLEVLSYRESHGGEIRSAAWRRQFDGRQGMEQIRFNADIKNIAGATLSCEHVTQGVHWLVALWQVMLRPAS